MLIYSEFLDIRIHFFASLTPSILQCSVPCHSSPCDNIHCGLVCGKQEEVYVDRAFLGGKCPICAALSTSRRIYVPPLGRIMGIN